MEPSRIQTRLRSEQGATIIYALFFFIICAVIGSVVLTAGTAAAGRISQAVKMDQRYYAVNSAAEVLEYEMDKEQAWVKVTTTKEREDTITTTLKKQADGTWKETGRERTKGEETTTPGTPVTGDKNSAPVVALLEKAASSAGASFQAKMQYGSSTGSNLDVKADIGVDSDYNLSIRLQDQVSGTQGNQRYYLTLDCPAHVSAKEDVKEETTGVTVTKKDNGDRERTEKRKVATTTTQTITWSVAATMKGKGAGS